MGHLCGGTLELCLQPPTLGHMLFLELIIVKGKRLPEFAQIVFWDGMNTLGE